MEKTYHSILSLSPEKGVYWFRLAYESCQWLQAERQLLKLANFETAKKEDEVSYDAEYALAA